MDLTGNNATNSTEPKAGNDAPIREDAPMSLFKFFRNRKERQADKKKLRLEKYKK